ncbi:ABC transporter ATP-binding protein [Methanomethylovorans sp.]|uniref:ABC transporter ATP-binding protein n=1 Tax=Methanomethylovorans sp. TaxID=2758717 RepID=UPI00345F12B1
MNYDPLLYARDLSIGYHNNFPKMIAEKLELDLRAGELVCLIGPNGAGKSTLIRTLIGMQHPLSGSIYLAGRDLRDFTPTERAKKLSVVLTSPVTVSHFRVFHVVALGRYPHTGWSGALSEDDKRIVSFSLNAVGAAGLTSRFMGEISDGEKQKVMIARGLAQDPAVLVLDEPTAFLDLPHKVEIMRILRSLSRHPGRAVLLSIHDLDLAMRTADRIWLIDKTGKMFFGAPEDLVLQGVLSSAFEMGGVHFDIEKGTFIIAPEERGSAILTGEAGTEMELIWTRRALERAGYSICTDEGTSMRIDVCRSGGRVIWSWQNGGNKLEFNSIGSLVQHLRTLPDMKERFKEHTSADLLQQGFDPNMLNECAPGIETVIMP